MMFQKNKDKVKILADWPQPETGAPEPSVYSNESKFVLRYFTARENTALIHFPLVNVFKFGSPNDEILSSHPLNEKGLKYYSVHIIENSSWIASLEESNSVHSRHEKALFLKGKKHYVFTFHDSTLEIVSTEREGCMPVVKLIQSLEEANSLFIELQNA